MIVRAGIAVLAALNAWWGLWARFDPRGFFDSFPGFGHHWTAGYQPYNEHLVTDLGSTFLTLAVLLAAAAIMDDGRVRAVVLGGTLVFNGLHLAFHVSDRGTLGDLDAWLSVATLAVGVLGPAALLGLDVWSRRDRRSDG